MERAAVSARQTASAPTITAVLATAVPPSLRRSQRRFSRARGHHDRDQTEQEGERDAVTGVEQADAGRAPRDLDRRGQRQQPREPE